MIRKTYRVYGEQGHRQRESFHRSYVHNFSCSEDGVRILDVRNADITGTNEYTEIAIIRNTEAECDREIECQISDGIFENSNTGTVKVVSVEELDDEAKNIRLRFAMQSRETGDIFDWFETEEEAEAEILKNEEDDKREDMYTDNYYEVYEHEIERTSDMEYKSIEEVRYPARESREFCWIDAAGKIHVEKCRPTGNEIHAKGEIWDEYIDSYGVLHYGR